MSDRLRHLQRQQALLREHLTWIDGEIAREAEPLTNNAESATTSSAVPTSRVVPTAPESPSAADAMIEHYASVERQNPGDIRRGCLLIFSAALLLMIGSVVTIWLVYYR